MLGDDQPGQPPEEGDARETDLGQTVQRPALHELGRGRLAAQRGAARRRGTRQPLGQDQGGLQIRLAALPRSGRLVHEGRR